MDATLEIPPFKRFEEIDLDAYHVLRTRVEKHRRLTVFTDRARLSAWLLCQPLGADAQVSEADCTRLMQTAGLVPGQTAFIAIQALIDALEADPMNPDIATPLLVIRGQAPVHGRDAVTHWRVREPSQVRPVGRASDHRVDLRLGLDYTMVKKDELILEVEPPIPGQPGLDVFGRLIKPEGGAWNRLLPGNFCHANDTGTRLWAARDGYLRVENSEIHVDEVLVLRDVDYQSGHVEFDGHVIVNGEIAPGFAVKSRSLRARTINQGRVETRAGLQVDDNYFGDGESQSVVWGPARLARARNARIAIDGDVLRLYEAVNCELHIGGALNTPQANIVGGEVTAVEGIEVNNLGSGDGGMQTVCVSAERVHAPSVRAERRARDEVAEAATTTEGWLNILTAERGELAGNWAGMIGQLRTRLGQLRKDLAQAEARYQQAVQPLKRREKLRITVRGHVHAGTTIRLGELQLLIHETLPGPITFTPDHEGCTITWRPA